MFSKKKKKQEEEVKEPLAPMMQSRRGMCSLEIGGKYRTLHFSMNFWAIFTDTIGVKLQDIGSIISVADDGMATMPIGHFRDMIYSALVAYDQEQGNEVDYDNFQVGIWLDDVLIENHMEMLMSTFVQTRIFGNDMNMGLKRNVKKSTKDPKQNGRLPGNPCKTIT